MNSYLLSGYMDLISRSDVTPTIRPCVDRAGEERGGEEYYLFGYFPEGEMRYGRIKLYPGRNQVELNGKKRIWVPLENICIEVGSQGNRPHMSYEPIGSGGNHLIDFDEYLRGDVDGLKEAFQQALDVALEAEKSMVAHS